MTATTQKYEFKTEVNQLLDLVIHSLYSHKDIFLRELISNASDAIDKIRYLSLTNQDLLENNTEWKIKITRDDKKKTLLISDNGIGMTQEDLIKNIGTIARSGTKEFLENIKKNKESVNLIGQFGVGFYSAFMVADKVTVISKAAKSPAYKWESDGKTGFNIEETTKETRGTDIILHLNKESEDYLSEYTVRDLVKKYSDFVEFPIVMDIEREEKPKDKEGKEIENAKPEKKITEETLNSRQAIWAKNKNDIKPEEYKDFYKHLTHDFEEPLEIIHYSAEGTSEFKALIYIPAKAPFDLFMREQQHSLHLYIKRVFIMNDDKHLLLPEYLRFIKGVVDSSDLPLNVSREILQRDTHLEKIKKNLIKKILAVLKNMKEKEHDKYLKFYKEFGALLKEGLHYDWENKETIADLLLYETTKTEPGKYRTLQEYVDNMAKEQKDIYYVLSENRNAALSSPHLEIFKTKNYEVLLMLDPIDEWVVGSLTEYKKKTLKPIDKGEVTLDEKEKKEIEEQNKVATEKYKDLLSYIKEQLPNEIKEVRFSTRLTDSAACLVGDEFSIPKNMEQMYRAMGQPLPEQKKILELNAKHPLLEAINSLFNKDKTSAELKDYVSLVVDQAVLTSGEKLKDPLGFAKKITKLMEKAAG